MKCRSLFTKLHCHFQCHIHSIYISVNVQIFLLSCLNHRIPTTSHIGHNTARSNISQYLYFCSHCIENLKSYIIGDLYPTFHCFILAITMKFSLHVVINFLVVWWWTNTILPHNLLKAILLLFMSMGWDYVSELQPLTGLLVIPQMAYEYREPRWNNVGRRKPKSSEENLI
jgi:hypothetical protein